MQLSGKGSSPAGLRPYLPCHPQTHRGREGWKGRQGKTKKTNSKACDDGTGSSQDNQEGCDHPRTSSRNRARQPYSGAVQPAVVSDHEGLLRAENARRHLGIPSASFDTVRTKSLDSVALWLPKGASWGWAQGLQTGTPWAGASQQTCCVLPALTRGKKKFKNLPTFKNRECSVKTPTVSELSHWKGSLCSELTTLGKFVRSHT